MMEHLLQGLHGVDATAAVIITQPLACRVTAFSLWLVYDRHSSAACCHSTFVCLGSITPRSHAIYHCAACLSSALFTSHYSQPTSERI